VFVEARRNGCPQRVEDDVKALATREFSRGHKVGVSCYEHDAINKALVCERGDVNAHFDIHTFLLNIVDDVLIEQFVGAKGSRQQQSCRFLSDPPPVAIGQLAHPQRDFSQAHQLLVQL
jgi:hypothetical protein